MEKFLTDKERENVNYIFAVLDGTIAEYGYAILDCGCETNGKRVGAIRDSEGRWFLYCFPCFDRYVKENNIKLEVEKFECGKFQEPRIN